MESKIARRGGRKEGGLQEFGGKYDRGGEVEKYGRL